MTLIVMTSYSLWVSVCVWVGGYDYVGKCFNAALGSERRRQWHPTPVLLPGKSHGRRSMVGYSPWDREGCDTTEQLHFHFSLSCTGEGNGNPLQYSCLGAWWAAVYGVAQSWTRLMWLSSSSRIWELLVCILVGKIVIWVAISIYFACIKQYYVLYYSFSLKF